MQKENYAIRDLDEWSPKYCEIEEEVDNNFNDVVECIKVNKEIKRIMRVSKRNWLLDPILVKDEIKDHINYAKEQIYYLKEDLEQQAKGVIKTIYGRFKRIVKR